MRLLAFDGRTGASGDMLLGALVAAGADPAVLDPVAAVLGVEYAIETVDRAGIAATRVRVRKDGEPVEGAGPTRSFAEVREIVEGLELPAGVHEPAIATFERLGEAEAAVHGVDLEAAHFHEVGADDAIADVVGVAALLADLGPDRVVTTPVSVGGGEVETAAGTYPVPPPAVVELAAAADWEMKGGPVDRELLTPTGAALLAEFAEGVDALPALRLEETGYGAGAHDLEGRPNVLGAYLGRADGLAHDDIAVLTTAVDDVSPEVLGGLHETLQAAGARDVAVLPATMKKARPGHVVEVVVDPADARRVARRLAEETGTLGVRETAGVHRWIAERTVETVTIDLDGGAHDVGVKIGRTADGAVYDVSAEYDDAARVARETGRAIRDVQRAAESAWRNG